MLTLDTLRRMARTMPFELTSSPAGKGAYRTLDAALFSREVQLPTVAEEVRSALSLGLFGCSFGAISLGLAGALAELTSTLVQGQTVVASELVGAFLSFAVGTSLLLVPFIVVGTLREVLRYARVRRVLGERAVLGNDEVLRSIDGEFEFSL